MKAKGVSNMRKFEYKVIRNSDPYDFNAFRRMEGDLNKCGDQGWELVTSFLIMDKDGKSDGIQSVFKREK